MTALTPDQAKARARRVLNDLGPVSDWTEAVLDQAVLYLGRGGHPFGANDLRLIVPEGECKKAGQYLHGLVERDTVLQVTGEVVSINPKAHGKRVNVYRLTPAGRKFIRDRQAARAEQKKAAA